MAHVPQTSTIRLQKVNSNLITPQPKGTGSVPRRYEQTHAGWRKQAHPRLSAYHWKGKSVRWFML